MHVPNFPLPRGYAWQYHFLVWLQSFHDPMLNKLAVFVSSLGTEHVYLLILPVIIWSVNRKFGLRLSYVFLFSVGLNVWLKSWFHIARPIGVPGIRSDYVTSATGLSMPSGHAQGPMTFFAFVSRKVRYRGVLLLGILLVFAIGVSRLYLGLHWPMDVLVGWGIGLVIGLMGYSVASWWSYRQVPFRIALFFALSIPILLYAADPKDLVAAEYTSLLLSLGLGALLEKTWMQSEIDPVLWKRFCTAVIGAAGILALQWGYQHVDTLWALIARNLCIGLWTTLLAPWLFVLAGLYVREGARVSRS